MIDLIITINLLQKSFKSDKISLGFDQFKVWKSLQCYIQISCKPEAHLRHTPNVSFYDEKMMMLFQMYHFIIIKWWSHLEHTWSTPRGTVCGYECRNFSNSLPYVDIDSDGYRWGGIWRASGGHLGCEPLWTHCVDSFEPLLEPSSETLLGKKTNTRRISKV